MSFSIGSAAAATATIIGARMRRKGPSRTTKVYCVGWDPEGILGAPTGGHIARLEFRRRLDKDAEARESFNRQVREEEERRRERREARVVPETLGELVEYFLDTEADEMEFEVTRLRPSLELGQLRFATSKTKDMEDRLIELEALQKVLIEGTEACDSMEKDLLKSRQRLTKILQSKDRKATLLDMVENNELNRSLLMLLDENIASAYKSNQEEAATFMENIRKEMLKYMTK